MVSNRSMFLSIIIIAGISCTTYTMEDPFKQALVAAGQPTCSLYNMGTTVNSVHGQTIKNFIDNAHKGLKNNQSISLDQLDQAFIAINPLARVATAVQVIQRNPTYDFKEMRETIYNRHQQEFDKRAEKRQSWFKRNILKTMFGFGIFAYASRPFIEHHAPLILKKITAAMIVLTKSTAKSSWFKR